MLECVVAVSAVVTAIATIALALMAWRAWKTAKETLEASRLASEQARLDSISQTRPYVSAYIIPGLWGSGAWDLRVINTGKTAARNLQFEFDGDSVDEDDISSSILTFMETKRTLAPGASIRVIWRTDFNKVGIRISEKDPSGMPETGIIRAMYDGPEEQYIEESEILIASSGLWPVAGEYDLSKENCDMKKLCKMVQGIAREISELRR